MSFFKNLFISGKNKDELEENFFKSIQETNSTEISECTRNFYKITDNICNYWIHFCANLRRMGFKGDEWKISIYNSKRAELVDSEEWNKENFKNFDFTKQDVSYRPRGVWFSNFHEIEGDYDPYDPFVPSWISFCLDKHDKWIDPDKCKYVAVAKFKLDRLIKILPQNEYDIIAKDEKLKSEIDNAKNIEVFKWSPERDWSYYSENFNSIDAGGLLGTSSLDGWDAPSWVAFRPEAFEEIQVFALDEVLDRELYYKRVDS